MKKITIPNGKKFGAFDHKDTSGINLRTSSQLLDNSCQYRGEDLKNKILP